MAGTRLAVQSMVLVHILGLVWVSIYHGFCRSACKRGNLTKDLPLVPGFVGDRNAIVNADGNGNGAVVEAQWWEDALCHPIQALTGVAEMEMSPLPATSSTTEEDDDNDDDLLSTRLTMTLAVENANATQLPQWIDLVSKSLRYSDNDEKSDNDDGSHPSVFSTLLARNQMDLELLPPLPSSSAKNDPVAALWSHYKSQTQSATLITSSSQAPKLVVYIPASLAVSDETKVEWKAFDTTSGKETEKTTTTLVLPFTTSEPGTSPSGKLQPLVEDWMARSILLQQKQRDHTQNDPTTTTTRLQNTRLTRDFPIEHCLAVLMPLIFPLLLPFLISWIKELKRYKALTAAKEEKRKAEAAEAATPTPSKTE